MARTPSRLLVRVAEGPAHTYEQLAALVRAADWSPFLPVGTPIDTIEVAATARHSRLHHRDAVEAKVGHALADALRGPSRRTGARQRLQVRLEDDHVTLSLDAGGELLHRRGWRVETGKAPLRENLAASLLVAAGWTRDEPLLDPFCGVGTIPIEAALLAAGRPPGKGRTYACDAWPGARGGRRRPEPPWGPVAPIVGADREPRAIAAAAENAARAGVEVRWLHCDVADLEAPAPAGLLVANPPYGHRLGQRVEGVYRALGRTLRGPLAGWRAIFLSPEPALAREVDRRVAPLTTFSNGGLRVGVWTLDAG